MSPKDNSSIRRQLIESRNQLGLGQVSQLSHQTIQRFLTLCNLPEEAWSGLHIGLYRPVPSEFNLLNLEIYLRRAGAHLYFPRIKNRDEKEMEFVEVQESQLDLAWKIGPYGIQEPHPELKAADSSKLDVIFVPGVAFGMLGERIGMGSGYYDRFFAKTAQNALRIALVFDFQLLPRLDQNPWDQAVHWVVTNVREVRMLRANSWLKKRVSGQEV